MMFHMHLAVPMLGCVENFTGSTAASLEHNTKCFKNCFFYRIQQFHAIPTKHLHQSSTKESRHLQVQAPQTWANIIEYQRPAALLSHTGMPRRKHLTLRVPVSPWSSFYLFLNSSWYGEATELKRPNIFGVEWRKQLRRTKLSKAAVHLWTLPLREKSFLQWLVWWFWF